MEASSIQNQDRDVDMYLKKPKSEMKYLKKRRTFERVTTRLEDVGQSEQDGSPTIEVNERN